MRGEDALAVAVGTDSPSTLRSGAPRRTFWFRVLAWCGFISVAAVLGTLAFNDDRGADALGWPLVLWIAVVAAAGVMPLRLRSVEFVMDLPFLLAAAIVLGPLGSGVVALVGATDIRELHLDFSVRFVWNRAQTAICTMAAAFVFESIGIGLGDWPLSAIAGVAALVIDIVLNYGLVALGAALFHQRSIRLVLEEMRLGSRAAFVSSHVAIGFTGVLIAEVYRSAGVLGLIASTVPVLLAYQSLHRRRELDESARAIQLKDEAVLEATRRIAAERKEERLVVAGALHDEVLPPLFKVHLMGQVLHRDLSTGRLLDLDKDLPELLDATDVAQGAIRGVVRNLRRSVIGPDGLDSALKLLVDATDLPDVTLSVSKIEASPSAQLLIYQTVREAITNAATHARASKVEVVVWSEDGFLRTTVQDDGVGYLPNLVDSSTHFGLQIMSERLEVAGGQLAVESTLGEGTCVAARVPTDA